MSEQIGEVPDRWCSAAGLRPWRGRLDPRSQPRPPAWPQPVAQRNPPAAGRRRGCRPRPRAPGAVWVAGRSCEAGRRRGRGPLAAISRREPPAVGSRCRRGPLAAGSRRGRVPPAAGSQRDAQAPGHRLPVRAAGKLQGRARSPPSLCVGVGV